jgi:superfamily II DNA or RNA helicase
MKTVIYEGAPHAVLRERDDWGLRVFDIASLPRRLWADQPVLPPVLRVEVDPYRTKPMASPAELMGDIPEGDNWQAMTRRSLARLEALALLAEDPQRRLDVREVVTLAHQVSLVRHVMDNARLRRVLIADEVGLGKTVEAALIIQEILAENPGFRVLYLAPARLVSNVGREFRRMGLLFREWKSQESDANLDQDDRIIASIHRAVHPAHLKKFKGGRPWDVLVVDECHHLSDWAPGGGDAVEKYRLVRDLAAEQGDKGYLLLLSGTPHQANPARFENLLNLLLAKGETKNEIAGRVIFRTKEDVRGWDDEPLFPRRQVNPPVVCDISEEHRKWLADIQDFFSPPDGEMSNTHRRAAGWRCAQALQWATSSPSAGLGYLVRQAVRDGWTLTDGSMSEALAALRPYRRGPLDEPLPDLYRRLRKEVERQSELGDIEDIEDEETGGPGLLERRILRALLETGVRLVRAPVQTKWEALWRNVIEPAGKDKIVLFAQPIETVLSLSSWLEARTGIRPAVIIGGQGDSERDQEVARFKAGNGPQFLISSRAGGEGINLQFASRLVHLDVPWNPMDMEQRVGRVHRFGSRKTIVVDTLVVKDSREQRMWAVARKRLEVVSKTMVSAERFDGLFSRVMCLIAPEELQEVLLSDEPMVSPEEEGRLASLVETGFRNWQGFHDRFSQTQRTIRQMSAGFSRWEDIKALLIKHAGAKPLEGVTAPRFREQGNEILSEEEPVTVLKLKNGRYGLVGDSQGTPMGGDLVDAPVRLGLNAAEVLEALRELALPQDSAGAALLRWPESGRALKESLGDTAAVLAFLRQKLQLDPAGGASELGTELIIFGADSGLKNVRKLGDAERLGFFRSLQLFSTRTKPGQMPAPGEWLQLQDQLLEDLIRPSEGDLERRIRYAVWPLLAAHIEP